MRHFERRPLEIKGYHTSRRNEKDLLNNIVFMILVDVGNAISCYMKLSHLTCVNVTMICTYR